MDGRDAREGGGGGRSRADGKRADGARSPGERTASGDATGAPAGRGPGGRDPARASPPLDGVEEEIRFYLEERARELEAEGMAPEAARRAARRAFGDPEAVAERVRAEARAHGRTTRWRGLMGSLIQDIVYALRSFRAQPAFAFAAVATLALALGANAAIFGVADAVLLRTPPVRDPGTLVGVYTTCRAGDPRCSSSYPDYLDYREAGALDDLAAYSWLPASVSEPGEAPRLLTAMMVTGNYFDMLGMVPEAGRLLQPADDRPGAPAAVAVLAHDAWVREYGADPSLVGRTLRFNGEPFQVVGVAPEGFRGTALGGDPDLFLPITAGALLGVGSAADPGVWTSRGDRWIDALVGRLAPGATVEALDAEMAALSNRLAEAYPDERGPRRITVEPAARYTLPQFGREGLTRMVAVLGGVVLLTLLLAVANVANLLLARASAREREMGVRVALGAGRRRLVRQLLVEALVLSTAGGLAGLAVAQGLLALLSGFELPGGVPLSLLGVAVDARVFGFALALAVATGVAFGLVPALRAARRDVGSTLRGDAGRPGSGGDRLRKGLVAVQVALCLVLLVGAGLFLQGLRSGLGYDLGARPEGLALARFDFSLLDASSEEAVARSEAIVERVLRLPGVTSAAVSSKVPLQMGGNLGFIPEVVGYEPGPDEEVRVEAAFATPGLTDALGIEVIEGRALGAGDGADDERVVLVNRTMAEAYWPGGAVGGAIRVGGGELRVVGVVEDAAWRAVPQPPLNFVIVPLAQAPSFATEMPLTLAVRTTGDPEALLPAVRQEVLGVVPDMTFHFLQTMESLLGATLAPQRMGALLLSAFGALALALAAIGIAGVVSYLVGRRRREIGIRMALGASRRSVTRGAVASMLAPVVVGAVAGVAGAALLGPLLEAFLVEVRADDPWTYGAVAAALLAVGALAAWLPARAAARVDPVTVLKAE